MKVVGLFLCVLALSSAASLRNPSFIKLDALNNMPYGRRILDTIALQLKAGASVDRIVELLDELADGIREEQSDDDNLNVTRQNECDSEIAEYERIIRDTQAEIDDASSQLASLYPQLKTTTAQLKTKEVEIESLSAKIDDYRQSFRDDTHDYQARVADHEAGIASIDSVLEQMEPLVGSEAGEGIHETSVRIEGEVAAGVFAQLAADQATLARIIELLEEVRASLVASIEDENATQAQAERDFDELERAMVKTLADLQEAQDFLTSQKFALESEIASQEARLSRNQEENESAKTSKAAKENVCEEWRQKYFADSSKRSDELATIQQVRDIFTEEVGTMSDYLSERVEY
jgi:peptidoglycan hydrolase CwlO-like protein